MTATVIVQAILGLALVASVIVLVVGLHQAMRGVE